MEVLQLIGAIGTEVGAGKANTDAIVASQGEGSYAAKLFWSGIGVMTNGIYQAKMIGQTLFT